ncbi:MAE_28990/MAE_18760 family HEPN-like nuclease [Sorangium sp. So ce362]|uniref:MAE_28990/MAE_18760 family HEPN-like nuclease n=1 Tax=Sorangium sp. So ce362 TaxID=3133303 RepID=UPI003F5E6141
MSRLRIDSHIFQAVTDQLAWRRMEIANIRDAIHSATDVRRKSLLRAGVPIVYAHWEGFIKATTEDMIEYVSNQAHSNIELSDPFLVKSLKKCLQVFTDANKAYALIDAARFFRERLSARAQLPSRGQVNTSNLNSEVFRDFAFSVGISVSRYEPYFPLIDESLLAKRNSIAHGEYLSIDYDSFIELSNKVLMLMEWYSIDIQNLVATKAYLVSAPKSAASRPAALKP